MSSYNSETFPVRLKELRDKAGLTQAELAQRAGLHLSAVTRFEQGAREPSLATASALAEALGVKVDEFLRPVRSAPPVGKRGRPRKDK